jgi:TDG/mug DNA glycosylase family protein
MTARTLRGGSDSRAVLEDLLARDLALVVCGSAAGRRSAELGQYYAGPGNKFWRTLAQVGLTPRVLEPSEYRLLLQFGIGLTDMVKGQSGADRELDYSGADPGAVRRKMLEFRPGCLCFNGKRAAREFLGRTRVEFGPQPETIADTVLFVAPSTSGAANASWDPNVWQRLADLIRSNRSPVQRDPAG